MTDLFDAAAVRCGGIVASPYGYRLPGDIAAAARRVGPDPQPGQLAAAVVVAVATGGAVEHLGTDAVTGPDLLPDDLQELDVRDIYRRLQDAEVLILALKGNVPRLHADVPEGLAWPLLEVDDRGQVTAHHAEGAVCAGHASQLPNRWALLAHRLELGKDPARGWLPRAWL